MGAGDPSTSKQNSWVSQQPAQTDTAGTNVKPSVNQGKIDSDKQAHMAASKQRAQVNPNTSVASGTGKPPTVKPAAQVNPNKSVASGTGENKPMLYKNPDWRKQLGLNQDDEMVNTVDDTAGAPPTPQRNLPASVYDTEGPESTGQMSRDARQGRDRAKIRKIAADAGMPDPYANRKMPAQMSQAQIDARNAGDSKFARDAQGNRKQSMAQALINQPRGDGSEFEDNLDTAAAAVKPSSNPYTYDPDEFLKKNPQPADASTVTSDPIINVDDAGNMSGVQQPEDKTADETNPLLTRIQKYYRDKEEAQQKKKREQAPQQTAEPVRPEPGTGAKAFAKQLGYSSLADFLKANQKNVNKAANGNWVVHPNKDYIPAK